MHVRRLSVQKQQLAACKDTSKQTRNVAFELHVRFATGPKTSCTYWGPKKQFFNSRPMAPWSNGGRASGILSICGHSLPGVA